MITPNINHTHKTIAIKFAHWMKALLAGCLIITLMSPIALANSKEQSNNGAHKTVEPGTTSDSPPAKKGSATTSDRPGKPDDHNSNGDDVPVRPSRQSKK